MAGYCTKTFLYKRLSYLFQQLEKNPVRYSGHSFRSGSASKARNHGFHDYEIKCLGHWSSQAYHRYIHPPQTQLSTIASRLAAPLIPKY